MTTNTHPSPSKAELKQLRALAHQLNPIVTIGALGVTDAVITELDRALDDHELIKIKLNVGDRDLKVSTLASLTARTGAVVIQQIGHTATLLRRADKPDPRKSNLLRLKG